MSVETLTYAALAARLAISPEAARSLAKRLRLPRSVSDHGKALVSVDVAAIRHTPRSPGRRLAGNNALASSIETLQAEIVRLEARGAADRTDFERERERAGRLMAELLQAARAAGEATARLEAEVAALRMIVHAGGPIDSRGQAARRLGYQAATVVEADRRACK